eukprot:TRINITY_DN29745_c0_g1_i1.p2 TRINITY_DN29745_c0_g1~~TRINITY_DN29745_c0_g1_i1.p2  ORF type:complete len:208 (+),score=75.31 TRINITY_DN29745_c0_g1_i1:221-844(+)
MLSSAMRTAVARGVRYSAVSGVRRFASDSAAPKIDPYEVFENRIETNSKEKEIKEAYRDLVKEYHPDSNPDADPKKIAEINEAYRILLKMQTTPGPTQHGDEPPVPRSELHERVYKAPETRWEETTQMMLAKIKRKYGSIVFWFAKVLFQIVQFVRGARVLFMIFIFMSIVGVIRQMMAQRHLQQLRERRAKAEAEEGISTLKLTRI